MSSDRNLKDGLTPPDTRDVLARIRDLSISSWYHKTDQTKRHVGPMAQDFHMAFGLDGDDDTHINVVDAAGISLAAIQEIGKPLDDQKARLVQLDADLRQKDARNARLEAQVSAQARVLADRESMTRTFAAWVSVLEHERKAGTLNALLISPGTPATQ